MNIKEKTYKSEVDNIRSEIKTLEAELDEYEKRYLALYEDLQIERKRANNFFELLKEVIYDNPHKTYSKWCAFVVKIRAVLYEEEKNKTKKVLNNAITQAEKQALEDHYAQQEEYYAQQEEYLEDFVEHELNGDWAEARRMGF